MTGLPLWDAMPRFNGADYDHDRDAPRLGDQLRRIYDLMRDGEWRTLGEISEATGDPPASVSAQLRHLRKPRFGKHTVEREHVGGGLYRYRVLVNPDWTAGSVVVIGPDDEPERVLTAAECDAEYVDGEVVFQTREE